MKIHKCKLCKSEFDKMSNYHRHLNRPTPCMDGKKTYCQKKSLDNHLKVCKLNNNNNNNNNHNTNIKISNAKNGIQIIGNNNIIIFNLLPVDPEKTHFHNSGGLVLEAKRKYLDNDTLELKDDMSIEDVFKQLEIIQTNKNFANDLLKKSVNNKMIDDTNFKLINNRIETANDIKILKIIINSLFKSTYFNIQISDEFIDDKIIQEDIVNEFFDDL
jgi:hypothetical protein